MQIMLYRGKICKSMYLIVKTYNNSGAIYVNTLFDNHFELARFKVIRKPHLVDMLVDNYEYIGNISPRKDYKKRTTKSYLESEVLEWIEKQKK